MAGNLTQCGLGIESVYGTAVTQTAWFEIMKEDIKGSYPRLEAEGLSSTIFPRSDRFVVSNKGAAGSMEFEVLTKGFGDLLVFLMGAVATTGPTETSVYTHTATPATLSDSFTLQVGRSQKDDTVVPWTFEGGMVSGFELSNSVEKLLTCSVDMDFELESCPDTPTGVYVLGTPSLPSGALVMGWQEGTIKVAGTAIRVKDVTIKVDNNLNTDTWYIKKGEAKGQPTSDGKRSVEVSMTCPYEDKSLWDYVSAATASGALASFEAKWEGAVLLGTTVYPNLTVDIPNLRLDEGEPSVDGEGELEQKIGGIGTYDGVDEALTLVYESADTTVLGSS